MSYPTSLDSFTSPTANQKLNSPSHSTIETAQNTALAALEVKLGVDSSAVATTIDYLLKNTASSDPGHKHTFASLSNFNVSGSPATGSVMQFNGTKWVDVASGSLALKFGGTGADGALTVTSGPTTIDCGNSSIVVKNYTSISITATGSIAFTNPNTNGTTIILKSQGAVTITSSVNPVIDLRTLGPAGGSGGGASSNVGSGGGGGAGIVSSGSAGTSSGSGGTNGTDGTDALGLYINTKGGKATGATGGTAGASYSIANNFSVSFAIKMKLLLFIPGSGAGGGGGGQTSSTGGAGGKGAGCLYLECGGAYNVTSTINAGGTNGSAAVGNFSGGGGGGGGGMIVIFYNSLTTNSGTYTISGGSGGTAASGATGGDGGTGFALVTKNTEFA